MLMDLPQSKVREASHFITRAGGGALRVAAIEDEILMITAQKVPVIGLAALQQYLEARARHRTAVDHIAANDDDVGRPGIHVGDNCS